MMKYLATLIANPSKADLDYRDVEEVKETLEQEGYTSSNPFWIESNVACDIPFTGSNIKQAKEHIKKCLTGSEIDIVVQDVNIKIWLRLKRSFINIRILR